MEVEKNQFIYGGTNSKKTWDQCISLFLSLSKGEKVWVASMSPKNYRKKFFQITGHELILEKIKGYPNTYNAKLTLTT